MDSVENDLKWTLDNLLFLNCHSYVQSVIGILSIFIAIILLYVVAKRTPEEMVSRKINVLVQLGSCLVHSFIFSVLSQTVILFPHKSQLLVSQIMFPPKYIFPLWFANIVFMTNHAISSSMSHYLGTMEGMRQSNKFLNAYSGLSFRTKTFISACIHTIIILLIIVAILISLDMEKDTDHIFSEYINMQHSLVQLYSDSSSLMILGGSFTIFVFVYSFQLMYLNYGIWQQLDALKPSISPRTWEILHHTSRLFLAIAIQPIFCFFIPTAMFISFHYVFPGIIGRSKINLNVITWTCAGLFTSAPFIFYIMTLISFKVYRFHFFIILRTPYNVIFAHRLSKVAVVESNKEVA